MEVSIKKLQKIYYGTQLHDLLRSVRITDRRHPQGKAKGTVLLVHGYRSHLGVMEPIAESFFLVGWNVLNIELPNHGGSVWKERGCKPGDVVGFRHYVDLCRAAVYSVALSESRSDEPIFLVGNSLGAIIALRTLQMSAVMRKMVSGIVCTGVPLDAEHNISEWIKQRRSSILPWLKWLQRGHEGEKGIGIFRKIMHPIASMKRALLGVPVDVPMFSPDARSIFEEDPVAVADPLYFKGPLTLKGALEIRDACERARAGIRRLKEKNILFLHGEKDHITPVSVIKDEHAAVPAPSWTVVAYEGKGHDLLREHHEHVVSDTLGWVEIQAAHIRRKRKKEK